jgi:hypothetical protein
VLQYSFAAAGFFSFFLMKKKQKIKAHKFQTQKLPRFSLQTANRSSLAVAATQLYAVLPLKPSLFFTFVI